MAMLLKIYSLLPAAVDYLIWNSKVITEPSEEGATSVYYIKRKLKDRIEGAFLGKTKDALIFAPSHENSNQLKG